MKAKLILKDKTEYEAKSFGADVSVSGEVVFATPQILRADRRPSGRLQLNRLDAAVVESDDDPATAPGSALLLSSGRVGIPHRRPARSGWILEDNELLLGPLKAIGLKEYRRWRIYDGLAR